MNPIPLHPAPLNSVRLATHAMATRFECVLLGHDPVHVRAAGEEALREITRIGTRFNYYDAASELSHLNRVAHGSDCQVSGDLFELLTICDQMVRETGGLFDPTIGPIMKLWDFSPGNDTIPSQKDIDSARENTGWHHVKLNPVNQTVRYLKTGIQMDLGGIAKGWALDEAARILSELDINCGILHGGTSSVVALNPAPDEQDWLIGIEDPYGSQSQEREWFTTRRLKNQALSVSAINGKSKFDGCIEYGHVVIPQTGMAVSGPVVSVVTSPSATTADAWSTATLAAVLPNQLGEIPSALHVARYEKTDSGWKAQNLP